MKVSILSRISTSQQSNESGRSMLMPPRNRIVLPICWPCLHMYVPGIPVRYYPILEFSYLILIGVIFYVTNLKIYCYQSRFPLLEDKINNSSLIKFKSIDCSLELFKVFTLEFISSILNPGKCDIYIWYAFNFFGNKNLG